MRQEEIADLLEIMLNAYPNTKSITNPEATIKAWELAFGEMPADRVYKAARVHMRKCKFFPTVADIIKEIPRGEMLYGASQEEDLDKMLEAPEAPLKRIQADLGEEAKCRLQSCILYQDICNGLNENGQCPYEGL